MAIHVHLTKRITTAKGKRYVPAARTSNGTLKPHAVVIEGREEIHPEGSYYMEWMEGGKRVRKSLGNDPVRAMALAHEQAAKLGFDQSLAEARQRIERGNPPPRGVWQPHSVPDPAPVTAAPTPAPSGVLSLNDAMAEFITEKKTTRKERTYVQYQQAFDLFRQSCKKRNLLEITRKDVLEFVAFLREKQYHPRTIAHVYGRLLSFLARHGITPMLRGDTPRYTQDEAEIYEQEELDALWKACPTDVERLWYEFFLKSGLRRQEVEHLVWDDISFSRKSVTVRYKPEYGWSPKNYRGREVPLPDDLMEKLKAWREKNPHATLVFPAKHGGVNRDFYGHLQRIVRKAGLDPSRYWLHKFRSTFCTRQLWAGSDLRTVMMWAGHQNLSTTLRYLKPNRTDSVREKVNVAFQ